MDRIKDKGLHSKFDDALKNYAKSALPGIANPNARATLAAQIVDSVRRIEYLKVIAAARGSAASRAPYSGSFQPLRGAVAFSNAGETDEAYWLIFLVTHFGRHKSDRWNLLEDFYGRLGQGGSWDWATSSPDADAVSDWLSANYGSLRTQGRSRRFGNHRRYESLKPGPNGTGVALKSYIEWIKGYGSHAALIAHAQAAVGQNPQAVFAFLYNELDQVHRLGRLGKFDYLCNLSNLMIAPIYPDKAYISDATGPKRGAKLIFGGNLKMAALENACVELGEGLGVSPQVVEDSLCNWQKSPTIYRYFGG
jgi:hypothetical protein